METITSSHVLHILKRTLDQVDPRLVAHGERVGYLVSKMLETAGNVPQNRLVDCFVLSMLHDVGAYKTEEIDDMIRFESVDVWNHSIYGALFLKLAGPLSELADAILYHHAKWEDVSRSDCRCPQLANLIHLADRIETFVRTKNAPLGREAMEKLRGRRFSGEILDLFYRAEERFHMQDHLLRDDYSVDVARIVEMANYSKAMLIRCIQMVVFAIDFRSEATVTHTITTVSVSMQLARLLGMPQDTLRQIFFGAYLHDLGKIAIPVEILEKPGALTDEEMTVMRTHVVKTGEIIGGYVSEPIYRIAVRHHEKLDGKGYPLGLREEDLTLPEEIVAVADIISALCGRRSYKDPFPKEKIMSIVGDMARRGSISQVVAEVAIAHYDELMANTDKSCRRQIAQYEDVKKQYRILLEKLPTHAFA